MSKEDLVRSWNRFLEKLDSQSLILKLPFILSGVAIGTLSVSFAKASDHVTDAFLEFYRNWRYIPLLITPLGFLFSRWVVLHFAPSAAGSGIPQVMAALELAHKSKNEASLNKLLSVRIFLTKLASNISVLFGGGITGREGPMVQIGASIFLVSGQKLRSYFPKLDNATLIASGGAAGIAAAFNTPLGGIVFAIEELIGHHFTRMRSSMLIAVILAGSVAQALVGPYLMFGNLSLNAPDSTVIWATLAISISMGLLGGISSKIFMDAQSWIAAQSHRMKLIVAVASGLCIGVILVASPNEYLPGGGIPLIRDLLWKDLEVTPWLAFQKWLGMIFTFVSGIAGGFFAPTLSVGALCGKLFSTVLHSAHTPTLILIGMVSLLSSMARAPFTSLILVSEMSNGHAVILPLMLASLIGLFVSRLIEKRSYYHYQSLFWLKQLNHALPEETSGH